MVKQVFIESGTGYSLLKMNFLNDGLNFVKYRVHPTWPIMTNSKDDAEDILHLETY